MGRVNLPILTCYFCYECDIMKFTYLKQPLNKYTFKAPKVKSWVEDHCRDKTILNLFAGPTRIEECRIEITNDLDPTFYTTFKKDALECVRELIRRGSKFEVVLLDPPYSYRKSMELYDGHRNSRFKRILDLLPAITYVDAQIITFGYHSSVMSKKRGFKIDEILLISHGGAQHDTIATVESRID